MRVIGILIPVDGFVNLYNPYKAVCQCVSRGKSCICFDWEILLLEMHPRVNQTSINPYVHKDIQQSIIYNLETGNSIHIPYIISMHLFLWICLWISRLPSIKCFEEVCQNIVISVSVMIQGDCFLFYL